MAQATRNARSSGGAAGAVPSTLAPPPRTRPAHVQIEDLHPLIDCGRFRAKRCAGDTVHVSATIFRDGHDVLRAAVRYRAPEGPWREAPMTRTDAHLDGDRWSGEFPVHEIGRHSWQVVAWTDPFATWQQELQRKLAAGQRDIASELEEGALMLLRASENGDGDGARLARDAQQLADTDAEPARRAQRALDPVLLDAYTRAAPREDEARSAPVEIDVERLRARFGAWYELFPRSWGGFGGVRERLPELAELGFDVIYLPPIHPIGVTLRKGPNDAPHASSGDPGSPYAIGGAEGGHTAVHPELGTIEEFEALVREARAHGMEIALDFAVQASADHPWLREHPEWFRSRPDGTLKYAENPPKRYMDIYNFDFDSEHWASLWDAWRDVLVYWIERGVRAFRVDNPHTKPLAFWEWLIESARTLAPETIFLSEAFTRRAMMHELAKAGFSQSYTYFTWKNSAWELREYVQDLARAPSSDYLRPNLFVNTPDILSEYLQHSGPAGFAVRVLLAATLSPSYGVYSGFEHFEAVPRHSGSEEYLDSEKYQLKARRLDGPLLPFIKALNALRREHPALQRFDNVAFLPVENDSLLAYMKRAGEDVLIAVVNVDPHNAQEGVVVVPGELGLAPVFAVHDLLDGERHQWRLGRNYVRLDPAARAGHLMQVVGA